METDSDYLVRNPKLIVSHLSAIFKSRCILSAAADDTNHAFFTVINEIDPTNNTITIDGAPSELLNSLMLNAVNVIFNTQIDGIKVTFSGRDLKKVLSGESFAFVMTIPNTIIWLQRRKYYRVKIPLSHTGSFCELDNGKTIVETINPQAAISNLQLVDLSISGFAALNPNPEINKLFTPEKCFDNTKFYLHDGTHAKITFVIKEITEIRAATNCTHFRIGCQFTEISTAIENNIQRYMLNIERHLKRLSL